MSYHSNMGIILDIRVHFVNLHHLYKLVTVSLKRGYMFLRLVDVSLLGRVLFNIYVSID